MLEGDALDWDDWPAPMALTDGMGLLLAANAELRRLAQWPQPLPAGLALDQLLPPASRILLQTHIWPLLHAQAEARELHLLLKTAHGDTLPVLLNARRTQDAGGVKVRWVFLVTHERSRFEAALLQARERAQAEAQARLQGEQFMRNLSDALPSLVSYWDRELRCRYANRAQLEFMPERAAQLLGMSMQEAFGARRFARKQARAHAALAGEPQRFELQLGAKGKPRKHWQLQYVPDRRPDGSVAGFFVLGTDITEMKESLLALELAALVYESTTQGIAVTDAEGNILSVNAAFSSITGYEAEQCRGRNLRLLNSGTHDRSFYAAFWQQLHERGQWSGEIWNRRRNGELYVALQTVSAVRDASARMLRYVTVFTDVTERWKDNERLRELALHDPLTGLANRHLLETVLSRLLLQMPRSERRLALLFLDLDGFKAINDRLGHLAGDALLKAVAGRLSALVRGGDCVARLGGDEFVVALDNPANADEALQVGRRIVEALNAPFEIGAHKDVRVGVSVGIAHHGAQCAGVAELLRQADAAMYAAKSAGKACVRVWSEDLDPSALRPG
ncbi:sensor domain-containing protein [Pseudorhodoferax sp.]|uniref:sensor domain-containing protein n=1 Tax=Pseudorhodoferax sp. TaxID=1993553 RepID=UPI002DD64307|nr:diguanylate cyclase [Pseudorhodoferax sp.]